MADVRPFSALRPRDELAGKVIAPPYDVLSEAEARALATEPRNFVRVTRSEVDLPAGTDPHSEAAYQQAKINLDAMVADGTLVRDAAPTFTVYGQAIGKQRQLGFVGGASVAEYNDGRIAKHEFTRPDKEDDRKHHMEVLGAQVGLVFLAYRDTPALAALLTEISAAAPNWQVTTEDGVTHSVWVAGPAYNARIQAAFTEVPTIYVADGHHRSAAASRLFADRKDEVSAHFLAGIYPASQLSIMAYNRVVHDLNGRSPEAFLDALNADWQLSPAAAPVPAARGETTMYLGGQWYSLRALPGRVDAADPVRSLDVSVLQERLLGPLLGIDDPRRSTRISFIGGIHGHKALAKAVDEGAAVAFHLYPTAIEQLFQVADAGEVMPPKSTWFEPKLREGVVIRPLDSATADEG